MSRRAWDKTHLPSSLRIRLFALILLLSQALLSGVPVAHADLPHHQPLDCAICLSVSAAQDEDDADVGPVPETAPVATPETPCFPAFSGEPAARPLAEIHSADPRGPPASGF